MAKIKRKPTPIQARILRALHEGNGLFITFNNRGADFSGHNAWKSRNAIGKPRSPTVRKMISQGWLAPNEEGSWLHAITDAGREALAELDDEDFVSRARSGWSAEMILSALRKRWGPPLWIFVDELHVEGWTARRLDGFALKVQHGNRDPAPFLTSWTFEIKVARSDWLKELEEPRKRAPGLSLSNYFAFAAPSGLIREDEVPEECGLVEIQSATRTVVRVEPPYTRADPPDWKLVAALARRIMK